MAEVTNLSQNALNAVRSLLKEHRSEFRDDFENIVGRLTKGMGGGGHGYGVRNISDPKAQLKEVNNFINTLKGLRNNLSALDRYRLNAAKAHKRELDAELAAMSAATKATNQNAKAVNQNSDAHADQSEQIKNATGRTKDFIKGLAEGSLVLTGLNKVVNELKTSYKLGFKWDPIRDAIEGAMMGMDPQAMMEFQAQFRRTSGAMESGIEGFNKVVAENQFEMMKYTGSLQAAAHAMGNMYELSHNMGLNIDDVAGSANMLFNEFKRMQSVTSITVDQFVEMNQRMLANSDVQSKLLRLNQTQRAQYIQGLNQQQLYLQMMGLQKEVAEQLISATENMSGKKGIDRLQDKYKTIVGLTSILKWDRETADRFATLKNNPNKNAKESAAFQQMWLKMVEDTERLKTGGRNFGGVTTDNEAIIDEVYGQLGLQEMIDSGKAAALQQSAKATEGALAKQQEELQARDSDNLHIIGQRVVQIADILNGWSGTALAAVVGALALKLLNSPGVTGAIEKIIGKVLGRGGGAAGAGGLGGAPGGAGGAGATGKLGGLKFSPKLGIAGIVAGVGTGILTDQLLNPSDYQPKNRETVSTMSGALNGAAAGAGLGAFAGPWGAALGGLAGGLYGGWSSWKEYQDDANAQMKESMALSNDIMSAQKMKMTAEKEALTMQIKAIMQSGELTEKQKKTVEALASRVDGINANLSVADAKQVVAGNGIASSYLSDLAKQKLEMGDTAEFNSAADQLEFMMQTGGLKGSAREMLMSNIVGAMGADGAKNSSFLDLQKVNAAIKNGEDVNIPSHLRKYFQTGMTNTATELQRQLGTNMASFVQSQSPQSLSDTLTSQRGDYNEAKYEVTKLQTELDELKKNPFNTMDRTGGGRAMIAKKEQELEDAKARLQHAADTARTLLTAANDDGSLAVAFTDANMKTFAKELGVVMKKVKKNDTGIKPPGL